MGAIQSSINNLLATATIAGKLTPGVEEAGAARAAKRTADKANKIERKLFEDPYAVEPDIEAAQETSKKLEEIAEDKAKAAFEANPSMKAFNKMQEASDRIANRYQNEEDYKREQFEKAAETKALRKSQIMQEDAKRAEIARRAETALKWETERVRGSTNFRVYQETEPVKMQNRENREKFGGNI